MHFKRLTTASEVKTLIAFHQRFFDDRSNPVALDLETTGLDHFKDKIVDIVLSGYLDDSAVIFSGEFAHLLKDLRCPLVLHNFKFDFNMLYRAGVDLRHCRVRDTMLLHHLLEENAEHGLDAIIQKEYNDNYKEVFWSKYKTYEEASEEDRIDYACRDAVYTRRLYTTFCDRLNADGVPDSLVEHVHDLALSLYDTEIRGIAIDVPYLMDIGVKLQTRIMALKPQLREKVELDVQICEMEAWQKELDKRSTERGKANVPKPEFSFDSAPQLIKLLYGKLQLPAQINEKTKNPSVDDASLEKLIGLHPIIEHIQEYRGHNKVYGAYIEGTLERMVDGRIYPSFNVNGTKTGRISASNPNLQQLPKEGGVRGIYVPDPGYKIITCDYGQLEVSLAAHFSRDKNLLKIVLEGASQHDITAQSLGIERSLAKTLNFGMQYRCSHYKVAKLLGVSEKEGQKVWNKYWETYSGLKKLMDECDKLVDAGLPIVTPFGRKRRFPVMKRQVWDKAYRQAFNALIQGTGADLTSRAYYLVSRSLETQGIGKGLFPVHDELVVTCKESYCDAATTSLTSIMKDVGNEIKLTVPLTVDCSLSLDRWEK